MRNNQKYWENRIANKTWSTYNDLEQKNKALLEMYQEASLNISDELYRLAEKVKTSTPMLSDMHKFNRLTGLQKNMEKIIRDLGEKVEVFGKENMQQGFKDTYSNVMVQMGQLEFDEVPQKVMEEMLDRPWLGSNFSKRLWKNTQVLATNLNDILTNGLTQGKTVTEMAIQLNNAMNTGFNICHRLIRTETMHYLNESAFKGYVDAGCKEVEFWAAQDERTCPRCGVMHGKKYKIDKRPILPLHALCRCTYLPILDLDDEKEDKEYKFTEAKTIDEARNRISKALGTDVNLGKMKIDLANQYLEGIETFRNDYPQLTGYIQKINTKTGPKEFGHYSIECYKIKEDRKILFSNFSNELCIKSPRNLDSMMEDYEYSIKKKFHYEGMNPKLTAIHECTHALDSLISMTEKGAYLNGKFVNVDASKGLAYYNAGVSSEIIKQAKIELFDKEVGSEVYEGIKYLGSYALTDSKEMLAQCISYEYSGKTNPFSEKVKELFNKKVKEVLK